MIGKCSSSGRATQVVNFVYKPPEILKSDFVRNASSTKENHLPFLMCLEK